MVRMFSLGLAAVVFAAFTSLAVAEEKVKVDSPHGTFVSSSAGKITINQNKADKAYDLATTVKVMIKGKEGKVADLKAGELVKLTMTDGKVTEIAVEEAKPKAKN